MTFPALIDRIHSSKKYKYFCAEYDAMKSLCNAWK